MIYFNPTLSRRQAEACSELQGVCEQGSLGKPDPKKPYLCIMRNDCTHWPCMSGEKMAMAGYATGWNGFRFLCFNLGICLECFQDMGKAMPSIACR